MKKLMYQSKMIHKFIKQVFPKVEHHLNIWNNFAHTIPNQELSYQAVQSIKEKTFHAQGGCFYSLYPSNMNETLLSFIVAFQTISDYLDNLCDRVGIEDEQAFLKLHLAITDALYPDDHFHHYYEYYPYKEDGDYLVSLVRHCKNCLKTFKSYSKVMPYTQHFGKLYSQMQSYKHIAKNRRESMMDHWAKSHLHQYKNLSIWEFSAASGSTLLIFLLCAMSQETLSESSIKSTLSAYFPWICGLHILLDYLIDEEDDKKMGDLNFVSYYSNLNEKQNRLHFFLKQSLVHASKLDHPLFHETIIEGLLAMYLSDKKAHSKHTKKMTHYLLTHSSFNTNLLYQCCHFLRKKHLLK